MSWFYIRMALRQWQRATPWTLVDLILIIPSSVWTRFGSPVCLVFGSYPQGLGRAQREQFQGYHSLCQTEFASRQFAKKHCHFYDYSTTCWRRYLKRNPIFFDTLTTFKMYINRVQFSACSLTCFAYHHEYWEIQYLPPVVSLYRCDNIIFKLG